MGESAKQASASVMSVKAEVKRGKGLVSTFLREPSSEIWIGVFIRIIVFYLVSGCPFRVVVLPFAIPLPEIRGKVPENFLKALKFSLRFHQGYRETAADLRLCDKLRWPKTVWQRVPRPRRCITKKATAPELDGRRISNL